MNKKVMFFFIASIEDRHGAERSVSKRDGLWEGIKWKRRIIAFPFYSFRQLDKARR